MCSIDWSALGIWVQAGFVAFGTVFAIRQYLAFLKNERIKRTVRLLSDFDVVRHLGPSGKEMTAAGALPVLLTAASDDHIGEFRNGRSDFMANKQTPARQDFLVNSDAATIIGNYFTDAARLADLHLIDKAYFVEAKAYIMTLMIGPVERLQEVEGRPFDRTELEGFVEEARKYLEKHPIVKLPKQQG